MDQIREHPATNWLKVAITAALGMLMFACVVAQVSWLNGSWYWRWPYRDTTHLPALRWYGAMLLAAVPITAAWFVGASSRARTTISLVLLMLGALALKLVSAALVTSPMSFDYLAAIVRSPDATSYYTDAAALQSIERPLSIYAEFISLPQTNLHTRSKPPGATMYYLTFIKAFGFGDRSAVASGIVLGLLATLSIPATFALTGLFTRDRAISLIAATLLALSPGYLFHFPTLDATYPILAAAMIASWHLALTRRSWRFAALFGLILTFATFITYNLLVLGALLAAISVRRDFVSVIKLAAIAIGACVLSYAALWLVTGFDPIATFRAALANQNALLAKYADHRPYPATIWFDLVDFALGVGWIVLIPVVFGLIRMWRERSELVRLSIYAVALPMLIAIVALLQSETSRVWIFMMPLLFLPAAFEMSRWTKSQRAIVFATMLLIALAVGHNMVFLIP